jgi:hypothetical protein
VQFVTFKISIRHAVKFQQTKEPLLADFSLSRRFQFTTSLCLTCYLFSQPIEFCFASPLLWTGGSLLDEEDEVVAGQGEKLLDGEVLYIYIYIYILRKMEV